MIAALVAVVVGEVAFAVPDPPAPRPKTTVDWSAVQAGSDASWPVCTPPHGTTKTLPLAARASFVIVGVNDGLPGTVSACVQRELRWATTTTGGSSQPRLAYSVIAADPWTAAQRRWVPHPSWPTSNLVGPTTVRVPTAFASADSGTTCAGGHAEQACAYVYGWMMAHAAAAIPGLRSPSTHRFWIDVEAVRDWNTDQRFNQAVVEGMVAAFTLPPAQGGIGTTTGVYSDYSEWAAIIGRLRNGSTLDRLDEWLAIGHSSKAEAIETLRTARPLTARGHILIVQWVDGAVDRDIALPAG